MEVLSNELPENPSIKGSVQLPLNSPPPCSFFGYPSHGIHASPWDPRK
jgi:hypothetical protein